ncbi:MAG: glycosyltransferase [Tannerellaceae bacterium]|jgi:GT2 family glycosyltransferase|nr:glycosyltransferase [Tannerellaceae bacterium]
MELSLIIIVHNTNPFITNLLTSLKAINCDQIFLLNGMLDIKSIQLFEEYKRARNGIKIMKTDSMLRHPVAINMLLAEVKTKYVFIMDSDILTTEEDLGEIYRFMESNPAYGTVQGLLIYPQNNRIQSSGHIFYEYADYYGYYNNPMANLNKPLKRQSLSAGFAMYPMAVVYEMNGFDEFYSYSYDGVDLSTKIHFGGYEVCCLPTSKGYHFHSLLRKSFANISENEQSRYWSTYGKLIKDDLPEEILSNNLFRDFSNFIIIDCSTIKNMSIFLEQIGLSGNNLELKITDLNDESIILQNMVPYSILSTRCNILWLCTNFMQIANNHFVFSQNHRQGDFIMDLSANIIPVSLMCK